MTIIVARKYEDKIVMATDGRSSLGETYIAKENFDKIFVLHNKMVVGCAGNVVLVNRLNRFLIKESAIFSGIDQFSAFMQRFYESINSFPPHETTLDILFVNISTQELIVAYSENCLEVDEFAAVGVADDIAYGALEMGAHPKKAVELACKYYSACGGEIIVKEFRI